MNPTNQTPTQTFFAFVIAGAMFIAITTIHGCYDGLGDKIRNATPITITIGNK